MDHREEKVSRGRGKSNGDTRNGSLGPLNRRRSFGDVLSSEGDEYIRLSRAAVTATAVLFLLAAGSVSKERFMRGGRNNERFFFPGGGKNFGRQPSGKTANIYAYSRCNSKAFSLDENISRRVNYSDLLILRAFFC